MDDSLTLSLDESEVRCTVADVAFRKDALASVPFCDDEEEEEEEARALHNSNRKTISERDEAPN